MDKNQAQFLVEQNEKVSIRYYGGSTPNGNVRDILPVRVSGDKLIAICLVSHQQKAFLLHKITMTYEEKPDGLPDVIIHKSLEEFLLDKKDDLENMGWLVNYDQEFIRLHGRRLKNGKISKKHEISIDYDEFKEESYIHVKDDGSLENATRVVERKKPWHVMGPRSDSYFGPIQNALFCFWELAKDHKPEPLKEKQKKKKVFDEVIFDQKQTFSFDENFKKEQTNKKHPAAFSLLAWIRRIIGIPLPPK